MGLFSKFFSKTTTSQTNSIFGYNPKASNYKMTTLEEIASIPVPTKKFEYNCDFTESIEYVLQRKATQFKKEGRLDLAIACLKKSNEIMPYAPMTYTPKDYERLEKYLKLAGKFDDANIVYSDTSTTISSQKTKLISNQLSNLGISDMMIVLRETRICSECAKYHGRVYSKNGKKGFPDMNIFLNHYNNKKCECHISFYPYRYGDEPIICKLKNLLEYSNRPFEDDRTTQEKKNYDEYVAKIEADIKDRKDYDWLCEHLPHKAPKSYGGYRNMKNKNSANYQKLVALAKENNYII